MNPVGEKHATGAATIIRITVIDNNYNSKQGRCLGTPTNFKVSAKNMNNMHYDELSVWVDRQRSRGASPEQIQNWALNNNYLTSNTVDKILSASNPLSIAIRDDQKVYWETQGKVYAALLELLTAEFGGEIIGELGLSEKAGYLIGQGLMKGTAIVEDAADAVNTTTLF